MGHSFTRLPFFRIVNGKSPGQRCVGFAFPHLCPGEGNQRSSAENEASSMQFRGTLCAEWGAREVAEYANAPVSPLLPATAISGARVRLRQPSVQLRLQLSRRPRASHGEFSRFM